MIHARIALAVLAGALAGCTSASLPVPNSGAAPSWMSPAARTEKSLLYVSDTYNNDVAIYRQRGHGQHPIGTLTADITFPYGLWVDTHRNLWVANVNSEYASTILRFPEGATTPDRTLQDPDWIAADVWVARDGSVYVVNAPYSGNFEIVEYPPSGGSSKYVGDPNLSLVTSVVGDTSGDLFASGLANSGAEVDERHAGSTKWKNTGISITEPGGLAFDAAGNLVVSDIGYDVIETFRPGKTKPSNTIACTAQCWSIAFNHSGKILWVDEVNDLNGTIDEFDYPSGTLIQSLAQPQSSYPQGVAASRDLYP